MKRKIIYTFLFALLVVPLGFISCNDVDLAKVSKDIELNEKLVLPIGSASATAKEIVEGWDSTQSISIEGDEIIWHITDSSYYEMKQIYPERFAFEANIPVQTISPGGSVLIFENNDTIQFISGGIERIDSAKIDNLTIIFTLGVDGSMGAVPFSRIDVTVTLDPAKARHTDGTPVVATAQYFNYGDSETLEFSDIKLFNLGYPENIIGIPVKIEIIYHATSAGAVIPAGSKLIVSSAFSKFNYEIAYGRFVPSESTQNALEKFDFDIDMTGVFKFLDPKVAIIVESNVGVPLVFDIDFLRSYRKNDISVDTVYAEFGTGPNNHGTHLYASQSTIPGTSVVTTKVIDSSTENGTLYKLFEQDKMPNVLEYLFSASVYDDPSNPLMWITPDARIKVKAQAKIPFYMGKGSYYTYSDSIHGVNDSINFIFDDFEKEGITVNEAILRMNIINHLPIRGLIRNVKFLDESGNEILFDNFEDPIEFDLPEVTTNGVVINPSKTLVDLRLTKDDIENVLKKTKTIAYELHADGKSKNDLENEIHIKSTDTFQVKLGVYIDAKYKTKF